MAAIDGSLTVAVSGLIAEPTVKSTGEPTGTEAAAGVTTIGGGVPPGPGEGLRAGTADGDALGASAGAGKGEGNGEGDGVCAVVATRSAASAAIDSLLCNLRFGGVRDGRCQQRLVADAREEHRYQVALGALDRSGAELRMMHDVGDLEAAGRGALVETVPARAQAAV